MDIEQLAQEYLDWGATLGWSRSTVKNRGKQIARVLNYLRYVVGATDPADVVADDLSAFMIWLAEEGFAKNTRMGIAAATRGMFQHAADRGAILRNPAKHMPLPHGGEPDLAPPPLSEEEVRVFFASIPSETVIDLRNRLQCELLYSAALRVEESCQIQVEDMDLENEVVRVRKGKGGYSREVPLFDTALAAARDYLAERSRLVRGPDRQELLLTNRGNRVRQTLIRQWLADHTARNGLRHVHPHLLRHSIAVHLLRGGMEIRGIQAFLGHRLLTTTADVYLRLVPAEVAGEYRRSMPTLTG
jgi:integrase/recombinase XerD